MSMSRTRHGITRAGTTDLSPESCPLLFFHMYPPHSRNKKRRRRRGRRSRRCGVSVANWPANKPHIHSATFNHRPLSRPDPGQGRAATDSDTCANSHFMATPGHQSLLLPCIPYITYRRHRLRSTFARRNTRWSFSRPLSISPMGSPVVKVHGPSTVDHGPWALGNMAPCVAVTQPPAPTPARRPFSLSPFPPDPQVESTASHDHLNVSIRPEFRAEEASVEHWYRAYWKAKRLPA